MCGYGKDGGWGYLCWPGTDWGVNLVMVTNCLQFLMVRVRCNFRGTVLRWLPFLSLGILPQVSNCEHFLFYFVYNNLQSNLY